MGKGSDGVMIVERRNPKVRRKTKGLAVGPIWNVHLYLARPVYHIVYRSSDSGSILLECPGRRKGRFVDRHRLWVRAVLYRKKGMIGEDKGVVTTSVWRERGDLGAPGKESKVEGLGKGKGHRRGRGRRMG